MYSWNTIRTVCAILLLIPVIHLAYLVSQEMLTAMDSSPTAWAEEVAAYTEIDQATTMPEEPIVVVGGRGVKLWRGLDDILEPRAVLMRGLGDATVNDITHYHSELIGFYQPSAVVLLPGSSEFHIRDNKSASELVAAIKELAELDLSYQTPRLFYIIPPLKTPLRAGEYVKIDEVTRELSAWAGTQSQVAILDANRLLTSEDGVPNPDFFRVDGINLNEHGYLRLSLLLQERIEQDEAELYARESASLDTTFGR